MKCESFPLPGGTIIVCSRGRRSPPPCVFCRTPPRSSTKLCDGLGKEPGKTCDKPLCAEHATAVGEDRDLCPACVKRAGEPKAKGPSVQPGAAGLSKGNGPNLSQGARVQVFTARVSYGGPDRFDVTRKSGGPAGKPFAPSWKILRPAQAGLRRSARAYEDAEGDVSRQCDAVDLQEATWKAYVEAFIAEMRESYRTRRAAWEALLARERVVLVCYCKDSRCHRVLLARDILPKLGATYCGELPTEEQRRASR